MSYEDSIRSWDTGSVKTPPHRAYRFQVRGIGLGTSQKNGELLNLAEEEGYEVLVTTDQNIRYQQNLEDRNLAVVVLLATAWPRVRLHVDDIRAAIAKTRPESLRRCPF